MKTYKERISSKKYYVILENKEVLGVFGCLKRVCEFMKNKKFPSYWTLIRRKFDKFDYGNYSLQVVKHQ